MRMLSVVFVIALVGCGGSSDECSKDQVEVAYLGGGARDGESVCKPIPAACGTTPSCANTPCIAAMYDLCDAPYNGVACSDTFLPPIISCNP